MHYPLFTDEGSGAIFSDCRRFRYILWRIWNKDLPLIMFIGLNPSQANEDDNDPTIRRVINFAKKWSYGGVYMLNCFPIVSTDPSALENVQSFEEEDLLNMKYLLDAGKKCKEIIFAWGTFKEAAERGKSIAGYFSNGKALIINKDGSPRHPLYVPGNVTPIPYK
jgi:hypothetical protein